LLNFSRHNFLMIPFFWWQVLHCQLCQIQHLHRHHQFFISMSLFSPVKWCPLCWYFFEMVLIQPLMVLASLKDAKFRFITLKSSENILSWKVMVLLPLLIVLEYHHRQHQMALVQLISDHPKVLAFFILPLVWKRS
jgi:hypothetical protein